MKILHLFRNLKFGGCQTLALSLINELKKDSHIIVYLNKESSVHESIESEFIKLGCKIYFIEQSKFSIKNINLKINQLVEKETISSILSWFYPFSLKLHFKCYSIHHSGMAALPVTNMQNIKNNLIFFKSKFRKNDNRVVVHASEHIKSTHNKYYISPRINSTVIHNSINSNPLLTIERNEFKKFIMIGRLDGSKDFKSFIKLANENSLRSFDCSFYIAGDGCDRKELELYNFSLGGKVIFLGTVKNLPSILYQFDVLIFLNSKIEGFGNVLLEGYLSKLLLISNNLGASKEIIIDSNTGFLTNSYDELLKLIKNILSDNPEKYKLIVKKGYEHALSNFDPKVMAKKYREILVNESSFYK